MSLARYEYVSVQLLFVLVLAWPLTPSMAQECLRKGQPKIVGGQRAAIKDWPGQAVLRLHAKASKQALYFCGGAMINERWAMTAAHCLEGIGKDLKSSFTDGRGRARTGTLEVILGADNLDSVRDSNVFEVNKVVIRDGYKNASSGLDIALIQLKRAHSGPSARLSLDPKTDPFTPPGAQVRVAGFGSLKFRNPVQSYRRPDGQEYSAGSNFLLETAVPTVSNSTCKTRYPTSNINEQHICAGLEQGGKDSCQGDSGGPLVAHDRNGCPFQVGIVSWGVGCAGAQDYGVYTRVSHHADWITRHVGSVTAITGADLEVSDSGMVVSAFGEQALDQLRGVLMPADRRVQIGVKGGNRVAVGREVIFVARSDVAGRLVVVDVNAAGEVLQILPNKYTVGHSAARVTPDVEISVPGPGYGFSAFKAVPPLGKGRLIALVVPEDFQLEALVANKEHVAKGFVPIITPTNYLMNLIQQVAMTLAKRSGADTQLSEWGLGTTEYEIVE
jgi:secreted trypsin-like serine protease